MAMTKVADGVTRYTSDDVPTWLQSEQRQVFIGDVVDGSNGETMGVGFARYAPGASNEWAVTYDEVLIVTRGSFSVISAAGRRTAKAGELIYLRRGTELTYAADDEGAEVVYVMHPHPASTELAAEHPDLVATFHPIEGAPGRFADGPAAEHIALLRRIYDPIERGEATDQGPFLDAMADDVVLEFSAAELRGKGTVRRYFDEASKRMQFNPFERPLQYFGAGDRVVQLGFETFRVKRTGTTHEANWAWVFEFREGRIARILGIEDLSAIADVVAEAAAAAQAAADGGSPDSG